MHKYHHQLGFCFILIILESKFVLDCDILCKTWVVDQQSAHNVAFDAFVYDKISQVFSQALKSQAHNIAYKL